MDVERKQIQIEMKGLNDGIEGIRKAKIKAKVKREQIKGEVEPVQEQIAKVDKVLKLLRPHLEATDPHRGATPTRRRRHPWASRRRSRVEAVVVQFDHEHSRPHLVGSRPDRRRCRRTRGRRPSRRSRHG